MAAPAATEQAWEAVIGLETHVQLGTDSKIFTAASTTFGDDPNTHIDPVVCGSVSYTHLTLPTTPYV